MTTRTFAAFATVALTAGLLSACAQVDQAKELDKKACELYTAKDSDYKGAFLDKRIAFWREKADQLGQMDSFLSPKLAVLAKLQAYRLTLDIADLHGIPHGIENVDQAIADAADGIIDINGDPLVEYRAKQSPEGQLIALVIEKSEITSVRKACRALGVTLPANPYLP